MPRQTSRKSRRASGDGTTGWSRTGTPQNKEARLSDTSKIVCLYHVKISTKTSIKASEPAFDLQQKIVGQGDQVAEEKQHLPPGHTKHCIWAMLRVTPSSRCMKQAMLSPRPQALHILVILGCGCFCSRNLRSKSNCSPPKLFGNHLNHHQ